MVEDMQDELIASFARILTGKEVDTEIVTKALGLLCDHYAFDCGLVYEPDQSNTFHLREHKVRNGVLPCPFFTLEDIHKEGCVRLAADNLTSITAGPHNAPWENTILSMFQTRHLLLFSEVDKDKHLAGFIVFICNELSSRRTHAEQEALEVLLSMLGRYVGIRMYQNKLDFAQIMLENILDNTGIDIYVNDFYTHEVLYVNKSMAAPYGGKAQFLGQICWQKLFPSQNGPCSFCPQKHLIDSQGSPTKVYSWDYQRPFDGRWFRVFSAAFRWTDGRLVHVVSSADITENKRNEAIVQYMAHYDALTNLPNRRMLIHDCERLIGLGSDAGQGFVLFFDIDNFKTINDTLGHSAGDDFLVQLGDFFNNIPILKNAIYRNGGDEFVALLFQGIKQSHIYSLAGFLIKRFKQPWTLKKGTIYCNVSIGAACYPQNGDSAEELLLRADQAMYKAKQSGGGQICFA